MAYAADLRVIQQRKAVRICRDVAWQMSMNDRFMLATQAIAVNLQLAAN